MPGTQRAADVPDEYRGREQAYIKHELLRGYLEKLFLIIGISSTRLGINELCYVDCFAGPWSAESESLTDTSIGISLRILDKCRKELALRGIALRFRAIYIEKDGTAFARLEQFLSKRTPAGIEAHAKHGDFVLLRKQILNWCSPSAFAFFFIDPTGWTEVAIPILRPLLHRRQSEFLINFMYDFVNRAASMAEWQEEIATLLGERVELGDLEPRQRENLILSTYRRNLKAAMPSEGRARARSAYVRVFDRNKQRAKYHLVYLTSHPRGVIEFMEISEGVDIIQRRVQASTKEATRAAKTGMDDMFGSQSFVDPEASRATISEVENYWLTYLSEGVKRIDEETFANLVESTDWFPGDFQKALKRLIDINKIRNLDAPSKRPKKPLHWEKDGERLALTEERK